MVFRDIEESDKEGEEEKKKHDAERMCEVAEKAGVDNAIFRESITRVRRLGKEEEGKKFRPLLVRLSSSDVREKLLKGNRALKEVNKREESRFRIDPDLTRKQQEKLDEMWNEARKKTEAKNGIKFFVIGMENPEMRSQKIEVRGEEKSK